ncbi:MAG: hypothetical protein C0592_00895 [Marinilabiliales bacterium]|nr:MAG: hypothetical protein C0592_00895 [Marinilabiliales bacterium]
MKKNYLKVFFLLFIAFGVSTWTGCGNSSTNGVGSDSEVADNDDREDAEDEVDEEDIIAEKVADMTGDFEGDVYITEKGGFNIQFPGTPEVTMDMVATEVGDIELYSYLYEISRAEAYMVAFGDYPDEFVDEDDPYTLLMSARDGAFEDMDPIYERENQIQINGYPALRTYAIGQTDNMYIVYETALVNNRLFQIMMAKEAEYPAAEMVSSFLDSFEITMD